MRFDLRRRLWIPETGFGRAPALHTVQTRVFDLPTSHIGLAGRFKWELLNRGGQVVRGGRWQKNLIMDAGMDFLGAGNAGLAATNWCGVGTDSTAPNVSQTSLGAQVGSRIQANGGIADAATNNVSSTYSMCIRTRLFDFSEGNGNLTEIGLFSASTSGSMWMRQLFLDEFEAPTTVVKTSDFQLRIQYELRSYWMSTADDVYSINVDGSPRNVLQRMALESTWETNLITGATIAPGSALTTCSLRTSGSTFGASGVDTSGGTTTNSDTATPQTYTNGNFFRDFEYIWNPATANTSTYDFLTIQIAANTQAATSRRIKVDLTNLGESAGVTKDNTQRYVMQARRSWAVHAL